MPKPAAAPDTTTSLERLFPAGAVTVLSLDAADAGDLTIEEAGAAISFVPARLAEFRHGRSCARQALRGLGAPAGGILIGSSREPVWPTGIVGSISHAGAAAAAVVGWSRQFAALGLDIETGGALEEALVARILLPEERERCRLAAIPEGYAAKLVFSIKEAAYKALWPRLRRFLDFHDIEARVDSVRGEYSIQSRSPHCPAGLAAAVEGRFVHCHGLIAAGAAIRNEHA